MLNVVLKRTPKPTNLPKGWTFLGDLFVEGKCSGCLFVDDMGFLRFHPEGAIFIDVHKEHTIEGRNLNLRIAPRRL